MYNAHYQFRESPFGLTPDPQFYYSNAVYREAWATLRYGIEGRKGFIVITGEAGTGKTTLLRKALHEFQPSINAAYVSNTLVSINDLLRFVLKDFGLFSSTASKFEMMERLNRYLIEQFEKGNVVALLIDEAHDLSFPCLEELRLLGNLETDKHKLLQIVLVGQPELERKLNQPELLQLKQRVALRCRLRPVEAGEVGSYIESRLQTIGHRSADLFDPEAIEKIAYYSQGLPRLINIICDNALLIGYAACKFKVSATMIDEAAEDLMIGKPQVEQEARSEALAIPVAEKALRESVPAQEKDLATNEEPLLMDSANRPGDAHGEFMRSERARRRFRPIIGAAAAIVLLTGFAGFLYSQRGALSHSVLSDKVAAPVAGKSAVMNQTQLAARAIEAKSFTIHPQPALPAPHVEPAYVSSQNVSTARLEKTTNVPRPEEKQTAQPAPIKPIASQGKESAPPARADKQKHPSTTGEFLVAGASFVRSKPTSNAEIIATLEPGTHIDIAGQTGEYYRVRSLGRETVRGYVHKEDAFFQQKR